MKDEFLNHDTLIQNGITLIQTLKGKKIWNLFTLSGDTILNETNYYNNISFPDINLDGHTDIRVSVVSNTPNQSENYFFDKQGNCYKRIENSDLDIQKVQGADLFFSYDRAGCADMNWESHLSKIENWKEVNIGRINAKGCGEKDDGIYIYKVQESVETLFAKLRIDSVLKKPDDKWAFIKRYWAENYKNFQEIRTTSVWQQQAEEYRINKFSLINNGSKVERKNIKSPAFAKL